MISSKKYIYQGRTIEIFKYKNVLNKSFTILEENMIRVRNFLCDFYYYQCFYKWNCNILFIKFDSLSFSLLPPLSFPLFFMFLSLIFQ